MLAGRYPGSATHVLEIHGPEVTVIATNDRGVGGWGDRGWIFKKFQENAYCENKNLCTKIYFAFHFP